MSHQSTAMITLSFFLLTLILFHSLSLPSFSLFSILVGFILVVITKLVHHFLLISFSPSSTYWTIVGVDVHRLLGIRAFEKDGDQHSLLLWIAKEREAESGAVENYDKNLIGSGFFKLIQIGIRGKWRKHKFNANDFSGTISETNICRLIFTVILWAEVKVAI